MSSSNYCFMCAHYLGEGKCLAFPKKIPDSIYTGHEDHKKIIKNQEGEYVHKKLRK